MTKRQKKNLFVGIIGAILCMTLTIGTVAFISRATDGFEKDLKTTINELVHNDDNLVRSIDEYTDKSGNQGNGLTFKVKSNKSIDVSGSYDGDEPFEFTLGTVTIEKSDVYTLSGAPNASQNTYYLVAQYLDTNGEMVELQGDFAASCTSATKIMAGTEVKILVRVVGAEKIDVNIKPTFVAGSEIGKF